MIMQGSNAALAPKSVHVGDKFIVRRGPIQFLFYFILSPIQCHHITPSTCETVDVSTPILFLRVVMEWIPIHIISISVKVRLRTP